MARGWESKSVEAQIEDSSTSNSSSSTEEEALSESDRQKLIKKKDLILSKKRVVQQLEGSTNTRYSEFLRRTLTALEAQIAALS